MRMGLKAVVAWLAAALGLALMGQAASAQRFERPHADLPSDTQPVRRVATTGYTLALSWAPEYCHAPRGDRVRAPECTGPMAGGFTLHGLWPDGDGPNRWPQYCHPVAILTDQEIALGTQATPSPQLLQHEWAKHGSCTGDDAARYFREEQRLFRAIRLPDMRALSARRDLTAGEVQRAVAAVNPGMRPGMLRLNVNKRGWLEELWFCLGLDKRPRVCSADQGGAPEGQRVRIQRPERRGAPWQRAGRD